MACLAHHLGLLQSCPGGLPQSATPCHEISIFEVLDQMVVEESSSFVPGSMSSWLRACCLLLELKAIEGSWSSAALNISQGPGSTCCATPQRPCVGVIWAVWAARAASSRLLLSLQYTHEPVDMLLRPRALPSLRRLAVPQSRCFGFASSAGANAPTMDIPMPYIEETSVSFL